MSASRALLLGLVYEICCIEIDRAPLHSNRALIRNLNNLKKIMIMLASRAGRQLLTCLANLYLAVLLVYGKDEPLEVKNSDHVKLVESRQPLSGSHEHIFNWLKIFTGSHYQNTYCEINKYLTTHLNEDDTAKNIALASQWYEELKRLNNPLNMGLIEALEQFLSLNQIGSANRCNANSYSILYSNDQATRGNAHKQASKIGPLRRIDRIVHEYSMRHAIECTPLYPAIWRSRRDKMDKAQVRVVENFMADVLESFMQVAKDLKKEPKKLYARYKLAKSLRSIRSNKTAGLAVDALEDLSRSDPNRKYLYPVLTEDKKDVEFRKDKVQSLFLKYLVKPCEYYVKELGSDVFGPAHYDTMMLEEGDRFKTDDPEVLNFLLGWTRFHFCEILLTKDLEHLMGDVAREAFNRLGI